MRSVEVQNWFVVIATVWVVAMSGCGRGELLGPVANAETAKAIRTSLDKGGGTGGTEAVASTGTGWATLSGRFVYAGEPPQMAPYNVNKEPNVCTHGGRAPLQETLLVDSGTKGIKNIVVFLRTASRVHDSAKPSTQPAVFDQKTCIFLSHVMGVTVGQPIQIKNSDPTGHNTKVQGAKNTFNQTVESGKAIDYVMQKEEATPANVSCSIHPWMKAYLLPRANGYYAISAADGTFKIENLPAGEPLEFQVWHESGAGTEGSLVPGTPETKALNWSNRGRFKVTLQPDDVKDIPITVPPAAFKST
jgi:hypothetical protein